MVTLLHCLRRYYVWSSISLLLVLMLPFDATWLNLWQLDSQAEWQRPWTWVSAHFSHVNFPHASTNIIAWICLLLLADSKLSQRQWLQATLSCVLVVDISLLFVQHEWRYAGFSSVLFGLSAWAVLASNHLPRRIRGMFYWALLAGLVLAPSPDYLAGHVGAKAQHAAAFIWGSLLARYHRPT